MTSSATPFQDGRATPILDALRGEQVVDPEARGLRIFPGLDYQRRPEDDFDMGFSQPEWVQKVKGAHKGERVFIFGTGPSLAKQLPLLSRLVSENTWTVNRMARFKDLPFRPTHHSIAEPGPVLDWGRRIAPAYDFPGALNRIAVHWFPVTAPGWLWCAKAHDDVQVRWEGWFGLEDYLPPLPSAWASPLTVGQLACWMGYRELYYLGVDTTQQGQAWDPVLGRTMRERNVLAVLECADRMRCTIEKAGRRVYDCTPGGRLNQEGVLPYVSLEEVLA